MIDHYSERADLNMSEKRLAELTDTPAAPGVPDEAVITRSATDSFGLINDSLRGRYVVPFDPVVPPMIRLIDRALRRAFLCRHRDSMPIPDDVRADEKWALKTLDELGDSESGKILDAPRVRAADEPQTAGGTTEEIDRAFGRARDGLG